MNYREKIEIKTYAPIVYRYYDYLKANHLGKENGIKRGELAKIFGITLEQQKNILRTINESTAFDKLVSTCGSIYMCRTQKECEISAFNEINSGISRIKKGKAMLAKVGLNGQMKMKLGKYYKDAVECFEGE